MSATTTGGVQDREPAEIQAGISRRRAALDRKLNEIERRLVRNPAERIQEVRRTIAGIPFAAWGAACAVGVGTWMAVSGLRRRRPEPPHTSDVPVEYIS